MHNILQPPMAGALTETNIPLRHHRSRDDSTGCGGGPPDRPRLTANGTCAANLLAVSPACHTTWSSEPPHVSEALSRLVEAGSPQGSPKRPQLHTTFPACGVSHAELSPARFISASLVSRATRIASIVLMVGECLPALIRTNVELAIPARRQSSVSVRSLSLTRSSTDLT